MAKMMGRKIGPRSSSVVPGSILMTNGLWLGIQPYTKALVTSSERVGIVEDKFFHVMITFSLFGLL